LGHGLEETFLSRIFLFLLACGVILLVSLFTGIYPAWLLSGVPAAGALRGHVFTGETGSRWWLRKSLVILQFSISIIVLVGMIVVRRQVRFMEHADIGFDRRDLLSIRFISWDGKGEVFKNELLRTAGVERCSISSFSPSTGGGYMSRETDDPRHPGNKLKVWYIAGDIDLAATLGLQLMSGRLFDSGRATDAWAEDFSGKMKEQPSLMTATTASMLGIRDLRHLPTDFYTRPVGIIKDFHNESLREPLGPTFIIAQPNPEYGGMLIRVRPGAERQVMASLQRLWRTLYPGKLLETGWVDDMLAAEYATEARLQQLLAFFSLLIMLLAALGVFGLIVHTAGQRVKEIGVRKVLGASVASIVRLLSTDFARMVFIAALIACPVAWWLMNKWLQDFAYRIGLSWWMFGAAAGITLLIAMGTVGAQAMRAAFTNPVRSLREE
jgi:putative ABC transport system permease protein